MALIVVSDGAEYGGTGFWDTVAGTAADSGVAAAGTYSWKVAGSSGSSVKNLPSAKTEFYWSGKVYIVDLLTSEVQILQFRNSTTVVYSLRYNCSTGLLTLYEGSTLRATSDVALQNSRFYRVEVHVLVDASGELTLKVDGRVAATFSGDTGSTAIDNFAVVSQSNLTVYWDDILVEDADWVGPGSILLGRAAGNGNVSDWTGNDADKVDNYLLVDEVPKDDDTTYIESSLNEDQDLVSIADLGLGADDDIVAVWLAIIGKDPAAAGGGIKPMLRSGGTDAVESTTLTLTGSYALRFGEVHTVNPVTSAAWSGAEVTALEVGAESVL